MTRINKLITDVKFDNLGRKGGELKRYSSAD